MGGRGDYMRASVKVWRGGGAGQVKRVSSLSRAIYRLTLLFVFIESLNVHLAEMSIWI